MAIIAATLGFKISYYIFNIFFLEMYIMSWMYVFCCVLVWNDYVYFWFVLYANFESMRVMFYVYIYNKKINIIVLSRYLMFA